MTQRMICPMAAECDRLCSRKVEHPYVQGCEYSLDECGQHCEPVSVHTANLPRAALRLAKAKVELEKALQAIPTGKVACRFTCPHCERGIEMSQHPEYVLLETEAKPCGKVTG